MGKNKQQKRERELRRYFAGQIMEGVLIGIGLVAIDCFLQDLFTPSRRKKVEGSEVF